MRAVDGDSILQTAHTSRATVGLDGGARLFVIIGTEIGNRFFLFDSYPEISVIDVGHFRFCLATIQRVKSRDEFSREDAGELRRPLTSPGQQTALLRHFLSNFLPDSHIWRLV